ncbi:MAG TPA: sn-glycerol-3-phosphate ABC transporter ATP-binding protein UgpC [Candidatus Baltobacteraceae bacterium]|nr:sn-glycerol-3-phosphate ABC transporter ATP-binding protein UgpC [Candidatus Baltobacteraceae bacterium]
MSSLSLRSVCKRFGAHAVVNDVNIEIADREFLVLVGPSGCGKTTTLRMIAGLEDITSGEIYIRDRLVNNVEPKDRDIAMVFQNYALYPHMNVYDNMAFGLLMRRIPRAEIDRRVKEAADILGIATLLERRPKEMSGGQRQRVALGRAIVRNPAAFLMDEPLSNLDAQLRVQTRTEIVKLHKRVETTVVYVTHDQVEAMTMGDRIVVMKDGEVQQIDTPKRLYDAPKNAFVAGFIGSPAISFLDCRLRVDGERALLESPNFSLALPVSKRAQLDGASPALSLGVRPEDVRVGDATKDGTVATVVDIVEPLGPEQILYLLAGDQKLVARAPSELDVEAGQALTVSLNLDRIHVFDAQTGRAYF